MKLLISNIPIFLSKIFIGLIAFGGAIFPDPVGYGNVVFALLAGALFQSAANHVTVHRLNESEIDFEREGR